MIISKVIGDSPEDCGSFPCGDMISVLSTTMLSGSLVITAWHVLRFEIEEGLQIQRVDANISNKQSWTADKGWSSSLEVGCGANNPSP